jgi:hypothetical protein
MKRARDDEAAATLKAIFKYGKGLAQKILPGEYWGAEPVMEKLSLADKQVVKLILALSGNLDVQTVGRLQTSSKELKRMVMESEVWRILFARDFPGFYSVCTTDNGRLDYFPAAKLASEWGRQSDPDDSPAARYVGLGYEHYGPGDTKMPLWPELRSRIFKRLVEVCIMRTKQLNRMGIPYPETVVRHTSRDLTPGDRVLIAKKPIPVTVDGRPGYALVAVAPQVQGATVAVFVHMWTFMHDPSHPSSPTPYDMPAGILNLNNAEEWSEMENPSYRLGGSKMPSLLVPSPAASSRSILCNPDCWCIRTDRVCHVGAFRTRLNLVSCRVCDALADVQCAPCGTPYCGEECAASAWPAHQRECK